MAKNFRPIAVLAYCWLREETELAPGVVAQPLEKPLSFEREVDLVVSLAKRLRLTPAAGFRAAVRDRLEGVEPTALLRLSSVQAADFDKAYAAAEPEFDLACSVLTFLHGELRDPARGSPYREQRHVPHPILTDSRAGIDPHRRRRSFHAGRVRAAAVNPLLALARELLRSGQQARRPEVRLFHYIQSLETLASNTRGNGLAVQLRRFLGSVGVTPDTSPVDSRKDFRRRPRRHTQRDRAWMTV